MMSMNFDDVAILKIHGVDSRCFIKEISKGEVINLQ